MFKELNFVVNYLEDILYAKRGKISFFITSLKLNPRKICDVLNGRNYIANHYLTLLFIRALDGKEPFSKAKAVKKLVEHYSL